MNAGIVGSGKIVGECLRALGSLEHINAAALCVRSCSEEKGRKLAEEHGIGKVYTDYDEFLEDDSLDIVYIGIINSLHFEYARKALLRGKNVLLEKPMTTASKEMRILAELALEKGLILMEAITTLHYPVFHFVKEQIKKLGEIKLVQCNFSQYSSRYDRYLEGEVLPVFDPKLYGGTLYDINVYNLHFAAALFGRPQKVHYQCNRGFNGVDTSGIVTLEYPGFLVECAAAKDSCSPCFGLVQGTKGYVRVNGSVSLCPEAEAVIGTERSTSVCPEAGSRMCFEWEALYRMWKENDMAECQRLLEHSVLVMELLEAAREDAGLRLG